MDATHYLPCRRAAVIALSGAGLLLALTGCGRRPIIVQAPPATVIQNPAPAPAPTATVIQTPAPTPTGREVIVLKEPPPPPRNDPPPAPPPSNDYKWVPGYWTSQNGQQAWVPGRWELPPRPTATWVPPRWEKRGEGYVFIDGYWQ